MKTAFPVPTGRELVRARLYSAALDILSLADLIDPDDVGAVADTIESERLTFPEPHGQQASLLLAGALRRAAGLPTNHQPKRKRST